MRQDLDTATTQANTLQAELYLETNKKIKGRDIYNNNDSMTENREALKQEAEELRSESSKVAGLSQEVDNLRLAHLQAVTSSSTHKEQYEAEARMRSKLEADLLDSSSKLAEVSFPFIPLLDAIFNIIYLLGEWTDYFTYGAGGETSNGEGWFDYRTQNWR